MATDVIIRAKIGTAIVYSVTDDRSDSQILDDILTGTIYPFLSVTSGITSVDWWLDNAFYVTRSSAPFDLAGASGGDALPFDLLALSNGTHFLSAVLNRTDTRGETVDTQFVVRNAPDFDEIPVRVTIGTPFIDVLGDPDAEVFPPSIACTTTIGTPPVTAGTVNRAKAGIGVYPRGTFYGGGYPADDDNLLYLETSAYLNKKFGTGFTHVREVLAKSGPGALLSSLKAFIQDTDGLHAINFRSPNPIALELFFPIILENTGYKTSVAVKRTILQNCANGDYNDIFQDFVDVCVANNFGTTTDNLWLETFHEFDTPGIQNPCTINNGNVDVVVDALIHVSNFLKARLPRVKICGGRISNTYTEYLLAGGVPSGKTFLNAFMQEFESHGNPSQWMDMMYQNVYDSSGRTQAQHTDRINEVYAYCQKWNLQFGMAEWGLFVPSNGGNGDNPAFIQFIYDIQNSKPLFSHSHYFEGLPITGMLENNFVNSLARFRSLFGTP